MSELNPSLYEMLLQNFAGELDLCRVQQEDQYTLSVLDNLQRILNSRAGALSHLPDYGLPDMGMILQGLPASAHGLMDTLAVTLLKYEP
ncbi:type VI secretion system protein [Pseudomonas agarici]|nr:type VI secretion system protein [Pseudomonas agarici]